MEDSDLVIFQEVHSMEEAMDLEALLVKNNIHCVIIEPTTTFNAATGTSIEEKLSVQVAREDVEKAREILFQIALKADLPVENDHYFHDYSDQELLEVIKHEDEWSPEDVFYARKLLADRNVSWNEEEVLVANEKMREANDQPEKISNFYNVLGFLIALCGGLLGIVFGLYVALSKKQDRFGNNVYSYDERSRKIAMIIFIVGISVIFYFLFYLYIL